MNDPSFTRPPPARGIADAAMPRLLETTHLIPWEYDLVEGRFTRIAPYIEPLLGYSVESWLQPGFWRAHLHPDDREWAPDFYDATTERGEDHECEYRMLAADGRTVWLRDYAHVVEGPQGTRRLEGFLLDISEQRQVQEMMEALARTGSSDDSDTFLQACVRNLAHAYNARFAFVGLLKESRQDVITLAVWAGDGYAPNFEYSLDGTPCKDVLDLKKELVPRDAAQLYPGDAMLVQMGIDSYFGTPLIDTRGRMMGLISVMDTRPMTLTRWTAPILGVFAARVAAELERKAALDSLRELNATLEQRVHQRTLALEAANDELEAFAYSVSHDLRAPLRAIDGFSQALLEDYGTRLDDTGRDYLVRVRAGTRSMGRLIDDLLKLSRITRSPLAPGAMDLTRTARDIVAELRLREPARVVDVEVAPGLAAWGDPGLLRIALENLFDNAWKYTSRTEGARIAFGLVEHAGETAFCVRDNGVGFDMKFAERLFGAFQRLHRADEFEGTGIGLATVRRIVHRHGGRIWAHAEPGAGATFCFTLGAPGDPSERSPS